MTKKRLLSLDVFRGLTIACMILVNTPGSWSYVYPPLRHADWHGCTPTDLVFPFFLLIVGVSMWFSFKKHEGGLSSKAVITVGKRAATIFVIGLLLNYFPFYNKVLAELRILGVLQRIALAFFLGAIICLGVRRLGRLVVVGGLMLVAYWGLLEWGSVAPYSLEDNLVRKIDLALLGAGHLWHGKGIAFDPEGLLSTIPSAVTVILGYCLGSMIDQAKDARGVFKLIGIGGGLILLALLWSIWFPINKSLWTSPFVLYTAGIGTILLSLIYWLIDVQGRTYLAQPWVVFGVNSLFAYVLSILWVKLMFVIKISSSSEESRNLYAWIYQEVMVPLAGNMNGSLLFALAHVFMFWLVCRELYRRRIFIKV